MTLEELLGQRGICGRVLKTHETTGYAWRGTVRRVWTEGITVHILLVSAEMRYERERGSSWRHRPDFILLLDKNLPVKTVDDGTITFPLPNEGGDGYISPKGKK